MAQDHATAGAPAVNLQPRRPAWGIRPPVRKWEAARQPILLAPPPRHVVISLAQSAGPVARAIVTPGDRVLRGQPVATPAAPGLPWVHASVAGRILSLDARAVAGSSAPVPCIEIQADGTDEAWPGYAPVPSPETLAPEQIRHHVAEAGIVGLGGALFPTAHKLAAGGVSLLILNGAECEPYINCDDLLLRERADRVVAGARLMLRALGANRAVVAIKTDMAEARVAVHNAIAAAGDTRLTLSVVTARYPAGGERQLVELITDREVPSGGLPSDVGVLCHNVATAAAVADFFYQGEPLIRRIVTVCGGGVAAPRNIEARIGTAVSELVALAGGYQGQPRRLVMGGPMMGIALPDDGLAITRATNCLIVATAAELGDTAPELPCIRCGDCVDVCPARLLPQELLVAARHGNADQLDQLGVLDCIECRACDYVCPSRIPLTAHFQAGKAQMEQHRRQGALAAHARERFEAREQRLARDAREQAESLEALRPRTGTRPPGEPD